MGPRRTVSMLAAMLIALSAFSFGVSVEREDPKFARLPARIWRDPGSVSSLNLIDGAGGPAPGAASVFTFVSEDPAATSPKFEVIDEQGTAWKVKLGAESQSETAATRFLWAAGYFTDEDYYRADLKVQGLPVLKRGQEFVSADGVVRGARMERKRATVAAIGNWDWFKNPFVGTRELNGLRVMMSLLNSWDLKQENNTVYVVNSERHYVVSDLGATFGRTGSALTRTRAVPKDFQDSPFIARTTPEFIDFVLYSRPVLLGAVAVPHYVQRTRMEQITKHIPLADVRWLARRLELLTAEQIRDGFRAGGFDAGDIETLAVALQARIAELGSL